MLAADGDEFFRAVTLRPDAVPDFVGDIYDLARSHPEHLRMINWARLEGFPLGEPPADDHHGPADGIAAIQAAQAGGHVDPTWQPDELLVLLFAIGLAWAHWPDPHAVTDDPTVIAARRAAAVEARHPHHHSPRVSYPPRP